MRTSTSVLLAAVLAVSVAGCGAKSDGSGAAQPPGALAIVAGARANMPHVQLTGKSQKWLDEAVRSNGNLSIFDVSGAPELLYSEQIDQACDSDEACAAEADEYRNIVQQAIDLAEPKKGEADTLGAILLAANSVKGAEGAKRIIVADNGLQTAGVLPLQAPGGFFVDADAVADSISQNGSFTPLTGIEVQLTGLGAGAGPQEPVPPTLLPRLETLWTTLLKRLGANVSVDPTPLSGGTGPQGAPPVAVVSFVPDLPVPNGTGCFRIREDQVGFKPNQAIFVDPKRAKDVLQPIASEMLSSDTTVTVVGTTALPEAGPTNPLSTARARAVVDVLASAGVPRQHMLPGGVGTKFAGYVSPYIDGAFSEPLAVQNRLVIIQPVGQECRE